MESRSHLAFRRATVDGIVTPKDAIEDTANVHTPEAARFIRHRPIDGSPFVVIDLTTLDPVPRLGA